MRKFIAILLILSLMAMPVMAVEADEDDELETVVDVLDEVEEEADDETEEAEELEADEEAEEDDEVVEAEDEVVEAVVISADLEEEADEDEDDEPIEVVTIMPLPAVVATPTASAVIVDGEEIEFDAFLIGANNYFKLRDLAYVLNGSDKQFNVEWDAAANAILLTSGEAYEAVGGEMVASAVEGVQIPTPTASTIYLDDEEIELDAFLIGGNNYFKLRDIMEIFDVYVDYDEDDDIITLDTSKGYADEDADEADADEEDEDEEDEKDPWWCGELEPGCDFAGCSVHSSGRW